MFRVWTEWGGTGQWKGWGRGQIKAGKGAKFSACASALILRLPNSDLPSSPPPHCCDNPPLHSAQPLCELINAGRDPHSTVWPLYSSTGCSPFVAKPCPKGITGNYISPLVPSNSHHWIIWGQFYEECYPEHHGGTTSPSTNHQWGHKL